MKTEETEKGKKRSEINHVFRNFLVCACILMSTNVLANNVRFNTKPNVFLSGDTVMISFSLSWDHAWRDDFNWDAVWVFGKYTVGMEDTWHHLKLLPSGHSAPSGFTYDVGSIDASRAGGVFLMLSEKGGSNVNNQTFTIKTMRNDFGNIADTSIANNDIFLSLAAMEMVYIPYGGYYLGDGATANRLGNGSGEPIAVTGEDAFTVYSVENGEPTTYKSLSANFPKGYRGFYCMKYEVSQEQYVSFLNNLTRTQQKARIGNELDSLKVGEYVFGDKSRPNYRNGICVLANPADKPAVFGCNLNPAEPYFGDDDGKCIACNYLTPADMLAYCDWACLRPMSELEYEKACRKPYPQPAVAGEFVWNSASGVNGLDARSDLLNVGKVSEKPSSLITNVNYDNADFGPIRCAAFGTSSSTQTQAGATFWGLMEMSGNVAEMCYSVNAATTFNTSDVYASHGNGAINANGTSDIATSIWSNANTSFIAKGGDFTSFQNAELMISDRTRDTIADTRDSTMGFRAVHTFGGGSVTVSPGIIKVPAISCAGEEISVSDSVSASATWNGTKEDVVITYVWYVSEAGAAEWTLIPNEVSAELSSYTPSATVSGASIAVKFKRKAICVFGEAETTVVSTTVPNLKISLSPASKKLDACGGTTITASIPYAAATPTFTWITETGTKTGASYTPVYADFTGDFLVASNHVVECIVSAAGCVDSTNLTISVSAIQPKITFTCGTSFTDTRDSKVYPTVKIGSQCWMAASMNIGERVAGSNFTTHQTTGIQKICYGNNESYCTTYGGLYNWAEAVNGEKTGTGAATTATAYNRKCAVDGSGHTQGICPDGWHVPSDAEFLTLANSLGSDPGTQLKSTDYWSRGAGTNSSGWNGLPGGYRLISGALKEAGYSGLWWSSSESSSSEAWYRHLWCDNTALNRIGTVTIHNLDKSGGMSVRCMLN